MNELQTLIDSIKSLTEIDDASLTDEMMKTILDGVEQQFSSELVQQSINQIVNNMEDQGLNKSEAQAAIKALSDTMKEMVYSEVSYTGNKKLLVDTIMDKMFGIFNAAAEKYHSYAIELPIQLEDGAQVPTYAHDSDAAADMYAMEDTTISAHSTGTPVKTGVHIQLPEGWVAFVLPRSSIGAKTPLRLSNSAGVIDSGYRGEVRALYDNIGDEPYQIHKGDRIAQMLVMPSYRFKANVVDSLEDSDRGEAGFGSTGV
jgi:dUTP pyrophosphatase